MYESSRACEKPGYYLEKAQKCCLDRGCLKVDTIVCREWKENSGTEDCN